MKVIGKLLVVGLITIFLLSACQHASPALDVDTAVSDATALLDQREAPAALELLAQVAQDDVNAQVRYLEGNAHAAMGNPDHAREAYETALTIDADHLDARANLGVVLYEIGQYEQSEKELRKVLESQPNDADLHYNLGGVLIALGQYEQAEAELKLASTLDETLAEPYLGLGTLYEIIGEPEKALSSYEKFVLLSADDHWIEQANAAITRLGDGQ